MTLPVHIKIDHSGTITIQQDQEHSARIERKIDGLDTKLDSVIALEKKLMITEAQVLELVTTIDTNTTAQGVVLAAESDTLNTISTEVDSLLAAVKSGNITQTILDRLQAVATNTSAIGASLDAQAAFSKAIASKGVVDPVPVAVPPATVTV